MSMEEDSSRTYTISILPHCPQMILLSFCGEDYLLGYKSALIISV